VPAARMKGFRLLASRPLSVRLRPFTKAGNREAIPSLALPATHSKFKRSSFVRSVVPDRDKGDADERKHNQDEVHNVKSF
jgi:hypothetical protein